VTGDLAELERARFPARFVEGARVALSWPPDQGPQGRVLSVAPDRFSARVRVDDGSELEAEPGALYLLEDPRGADRPSGPPERV
jgi:hypothetical protein